MKATMDSQGMITISAENGVEAFALSEWDKKANIEVDDQMRMLKRHINPVWLCINANDPEEVKP